MGSLEIPRRDLQQFGIDQDDARLKLLIPIHTSNVAPIAVPMPGVRCKNCDAQGRETWVIPGKACHVCGAQCSLMDGDTDVSITFDNDGLKAYI